MFDSFAPWKEHLFEVEAEAGLTAEQKPVSLSLSLAPPAMPLCSTIKRLDTFWDGCSFTFCTLRSLDEHGESRRSPSRQTRSRAERPCPSRTSPPPFPTRQRPARWMLTEPMRLLNEQVARSPRRRLVDCHRHPRLRLLPRRWLHRRASLFPPLPFSFRIASLLTLALCTSQIFRETQPRRERSRWPSRPLPPPSPYLLKAWLDEMNHLSSLQRQS